MVAEELNALVDNLAEKMGVAVENLRPVAEEVIGQYVIREWTAAGIFCGLAVMAVGACLIFWRASFHIKEESASNVAAVFGWTAFGVAALSTAAACQHILAALAPLPTLLGL